MKVQDRPTTIYVRDIDEATSKNFSRLKKRYASNSNTDVVKRLINDFEGKEEELTECKTMIAEQKEKIERMQRIILDFQESHNTLLNFMP